MAQQRYHVIERIDAGGMAEVFKANSTSLQGFEKLVAIKRILPKLSKNERFIRMFLDEAKLSLHLSHTNCVQVFDLGLADGTYFIVMEFVDGVNLKHVIEESRARKRPIPVEQTGYVALEICKGLAHAHDKRDQKGHHLQIVHRDISPPNILISAEGEVKITDFGLAKAKSQVEQTDPGVVKGKFGYLSPEAAHGEDVDARTDIFAVGILMWEMLAGRRLFLGETDIGTLKQVRANNVPPLGKFRKDIPEDLERIIRRALTSDLGKRYQTVRDLGQDLAKFLFSYGHPVTSFDISSWVDSIRRKQPKHKRSEKDKAVEAAIQDAVNRIVTLEEVDDLDRFMAEQYESLPDQGADLDTTSGDFVDPRMWADMGFSDMDLSVEEPENSDAWEERNVTELIRLRQTNQAGHAAVSREMANSAAVKTEEPEATKQLSRAELSDLEGRMRDDAMRRASGMGEVKQKGPDSVSQAMAAVQKTDFDDEPPPGVVTAGAAAQKKSGGPPMGIIVAVLVAVVAAALVLALIVGT